MGLEDYQGLTESEKLTVLCVKMDNVEKHLEERRNNWAPITAYAAVIIAGMALVVSYIH